MALSGAFTENQVLQWLDENLIDANKIQACCESIIHVPQVKGIYFWFIKASSYPLISKYVHIENTPPSFTKNINGEEYDLIYIGTAGTGKKGNSNLQERLSWHLCQSHTNTNVYHGTLSTLRAGISALLSDDLIDTNVEHDLNQIFINHFYIYWVTYDYNTKDIDKDEYLLINRIKPVFNLKNNPNALSREINNTTKIYKQRRVQIIKNTKRRLARIHESPIDIRSNQSEIVQSTLFAEQILTEKTTDNIKCIEYFVQKDQDIAEVTNGIADLHRGKVKIKIYNSERPSQIFDLWQFRSTGNDNDLNAQNVFTFFSNTCPERLHDIAKTRNKGIAWWMNENNIAEITVKIYWEIPYK
jgi:hypothetical protein